LCIRGRVNFASGGEWTRVIGLLPIHIPAKMSAGRAYSQGSRKIARSVLTYYIPFPSRSQLPPASGPSHRGVSAQSATRKSLKRWRGAEFAIRTVSPRVGLDSRRREPVCRRHVQSNASLVWNRYGAGVYFPRAHAAIRHSIWKGELR
jgi:hypothetical protein